MKEVPLSRYWQRHVHKKFLVCGLGPSLENLPDEIPDDIITIGVNHIWERRQPRYLLLMDRPSAFEKKDKIDVILESEPEAAFISHAVAPLWKKFGMENVVPWMDCSISLAPDHTIPSWFDRQAQLHIFTMSTTSAISLAGFMGASQIGVIGMDLQGHTLMSRLDRIDRALMKFNCWLGKQHIDMVNLSPTSMVESLPFQSIGAFLDA